jgi:nucleoside-diphosphate-sugar epimerase
MANRSASLPAATAASRPVAEPVARVLVTGAGGYIGTVLVPMLLDEGYAVRAVDRFFFGMKLPAGHPCLEIVREDTRRLTPAHFQGVDAVIDLAALSNDPSGDRFEGATWAINRTARIEAAKLAKASGVARYILPSSCSLYGFQPPDVVATEASPVNPLTTYAKANLAAEDGVLALADARFAVVVLRQATVYGFSPRMRFDLAINGMTYGAWKTGRLPLMRDGLQWRPMIHVRDTARAQVFMLTADPAQVNGGIFNVGSAENVYQIGPLGELVASLVGRPVEIEWYGDPDRRSYRVGFDKIEAVGFKARLTAADGVAELVALLDQGRLEKGPETITLDWYSELVRWQRIVRETELHGGMIDI